MVIDTNLERMYHAGKVDVPHAADRLDTIATRLYEHLQTFNQQAALAGDPAIMRSMLQVGGDVYDVLRGGVTSLNNCALALIQTADDFRRTDQDAKDDFQTMDEQLKNMGTPTGETPPPALLDPEAPGSTVPNDDGGSTTTPSTPDPIAPSEDAEQRERNEDGSESAHEREKRRG